MENPKVQPILLKGPSLVSDIVYVKYFTHIYVHIHKVSLSLVSDIVYFKYFTHTCTHTQSLYKSGE